MKKQDNKMSITSFAIIFMTLTVFGCNNEAFNSTNDEMDGGTVAESKRQETDDSGCFSENNYVEVLTLEEAIKSAHIDFRIEQSVDYYVDFQKSIKRYGFDRAFPMWSQQWRFVSVDNYRRFLSDTAACNRGGEPLKTFISKIVTDESFFKSRISMDSYDLTEFNKAVMPSFKFYYKINPVMCRGNICGTETDINSWKELGKNMAVFILSRNGYIEDTYTFTRKNGHWYLTEYSPFDERGLMETY